MTDVSHKYGGLYAKDKNRKICNKMFYKKTVDTRSLRNNHLNFRLFIDRTESGYLYKDHIRLTYQIISHWKTETFYAFLFFSLNKFDHLTKVFHHFNHLIILLWLHLSPKTPTSHPFKQLPFTWWHCSALLQLPQVLLHPGPYFMLLHSWWK